MSLWSFQGPRGLERPVLQNSTAYVTVLRTAQHRRGRRCSRRAGCPDGRSHQGDRRLPEYKSSGIPRKEVIQPQLPLRLPCYDFTPIIDPTFDGCLPKGVSPPASGIANFRGVTGGVYKARERIHRGIADPRLLATPPS